MHNKLRSLIALALSFLFLHNSYSALYATAQEDSLETTPIIEAGLPEDIRDWELAKNDWLVINIESNTLQFIREDNSEKSAKIRIGSGEIRENGGRMCYLGICYDPRTPEKVWEIRSKNQQHWYNVFGSKESDEQLFLRLYELKGGERIRTYYGIHTTPEIETIFKEKDGFASWGCILARYDLLKKIEALYELNGGVVKVVTSSLQADDVIALL